jgi:excisionase family DNA binding protein
MSNEIGTRLSAIEYALVQLAQQLEALQTKPPRKFISRREFADANGLSTVTVDRMIREGRLACTRQGRRVLIPADAEIGER